MLTQVPRGGACTAARLSSAAELAPFQVTAVDTWGNATAPAEGLSASVVVECGALVPSSASFAIGTSGLATIDGTCDRQLALAVLCHYA